MGQLAVRPVGLPPLFEEGQHLLGLCGQQGVHRRPARCTVGQGAAGAAAQPAVHPPLRQLQDLAGMPQPPAAIQGLLNQIEQAGLGDHIDPAWDPAT